MTTMTDFADSPELVALRDEIEQLRTALTSRALIDEAKGIVMALRRCTDDAAFAEISRESQQHNIRVRDLAAELVHLTSGEDPRGGSGHAPGSRIDQVRQVVRSVFVDELDRWGAVPPA